MTKLELIQQNKKRYEDQIKKNEQMTGLSKLVGEYLMLPWIKGTNWMGGLPDSKSNKAFEKIMDMGYTFDEIDDEWQEQMDEQLPITESANQYYGLNDKGESVYVAMSEQEVIDYAKKNPKEGIVRVEDKFNHGYNLKESIKKSRKTVLMEELKNWDKKEFDENSNSYELEMLYESVKTTLSAQQKNDLARFVRKAKTAEEINTYMTGMLAQDKMTEGLKIQAYGKQRRIPKSLSNYMHTGKGYDMDARFLEAAIEDTLYDDDGNYLGILDADKICRELNADKNFLYTVKPFKSTKDSVKIIATDYNGNEDIISISKEANKPLSEAFDKEPHEFWYYTKHGLGPGTIPKDVNVLDVKEDDNWGTYIKLDKVLTTDELNKYEIKEKVPPNELTEEVDEESFNKLKELAYELDEYIEDKVWVRDFWYDGQFEQTISFEIYGDWKHDHARFDYYAQEWLDNKGLDYNIQETVTDDDGSDSYGAIHTIRIYKGI